MRRPETAVLLAAIAIVLAMLVYVAIF